MSDYTLYQGDCLEVMPTLEKGSVAMVFADLPYGSTQFCWDKHVNISDLWPALKRAANLHASLCLTAIQPYASFLVTKFSKDFRYDLIWAKGKGTGHLSAKKRPMRAHEHVLVFGKQKTYNAQKTIGRYAHRSGGQKTPTVGHYQKHAKTKCEKTMMRYPTSVLSIPITGTDNFGNCPENKRIHPTQKPVALLEWLIATYTNPGDLVLDPVFGSGTTGVACANLGRRFIGIEKDPIYFAAGKARIEKAYADAAAGPVQGRLAV